MILRPIRNFWVYSVLFCDHFVDDLESGGGEFMDDFDYVLVESSVGGQPEEDHCELEPVV